MPTPPPGGYQQGGWYDGRQYWDGTFSDPGQINKLSDQQGAGQDVSREVVNQSDPLSGQATGTNWDYIQQQKAKATPSSYAPGVKGSSTSNSASSPGTSAIDLSGLSPNAGFDITKINNQLYADSGISADEAKLSEMDRGFIEAKGEINDNPYLSEATRAGREATLTKLHDERTANIRNDIATKKADIEAKTNLQLKQYDINSQEYQQTWQKALNLFEMGAFDNASGEAIAELTRATGVSSDMWQSAINAQKQKNVKTSMIQSTADSGEVTVSVINSDTGEIISQQSLGKIGNAQTGPKQTEAEKSTQLRSQMIQALEGSKNSYGHITPQDWQGAMASWISRGGDAEDFVKNFKQYADPNRDDFDQVYYER